MIRIIINFDMSNNIRKISYLLPILILSLCIELSGKELSKNKKKIALLIEESERLYKEGKYEESIERLKEAIELYPHPVLFYNIGKCYEKLGNSCKAVEYYEKYLNKVKEISVEEAKEIAEKIKDLNLELSLIHI